MTAPGPEQADLRVVALTAETALSGAYSAFCGSAPSRSSSHASTLRDSCAASVRAEASAGTSEGQLQQAV